MPLIHALFKLFNIQLESFTNLNEVGSSYFYIAHKTFSYDGKWFQICYENHEIFPDLFNKNQTVLKDIYDIFGIETNVSKSVFPRSSSGLLENPLMEAVKENFNLNLLFQTLLKT